MGAVLSKQDIKRLYHGVTSASFFTGGVFECDLAHRRSVAVLCMLYKIRCNPMHPPYVALSEPYVANAFILAYMLLSPFTSPTVFIFSAFVFWVGIMGLGSSD